MVNDLLFYFSILFKTLFFPKNPLSLQNESLLEVQHFTLILPSHYLHSPFLSSNPFTDSNFLWPSFLLFLTLGFLFHLHFRHLFSLSSSLDFILFRFRVFSKAGGVWSTDSWMEASAAAGVAAARGVSLPVSSSSAQASRKEWRAVSEQSLRNSSSEVLFADAKSFFSHCLLFLI